MGGANEINFGSRYRVAHSHLQWVTPFLCGGWAAESARIRGSAISRKDPVDGCARAFWGGLVSGGFVLFGSDVILNDGKEPAVALEIKPGSDLGSTLHSVLDQIDGYGMEVVSDHFVNVYPRRFRGDAADVLNLRVPSFNLVNTRAGAILAGPERFIPVLKDRLTLPLEPGKQRLDLYVLGLNQSGPVVTLQLCYITVRQILNAVSKATEGYGPPDIPLGWAYLSEPDPKSNVPVHSWKPLYSLPRDWRARPKNAEEVPK